MRVGTMWLGIDVPSGETTSCYDLTGGVPIPIPPSGAYQTEHSVLKAWIPGEYRFKLDLRDEDDNLLSDDARTSNTFRIDE